MRIKSTTAFRAYADARAKRSIEQAAATVRFMVKSVNKDGSISRMAPTRNGWKYDAFAAIWGSPYVTDGKIFLGDEDGDVAILATGKTLKVLGEINMGNAVYATPAAHDGILYILSRKRLYAIKDGIPAKPAEDAKAAAR